jgi:Family of unknown function (DUF5681)
MTPLSDRYSMARPKPSAPPWSPGQSGNPKGRPVGSRNKLNEKFILALHDDFAKHGRGVIERVREQRPDVYLKVIASILPRELHWKNEPLFQGTTDEQLDELLESIRGVLAARTPTSGGTGDEASRGGDKPDRVH